MKPKILNDITNIFAKLAGSKDYDPRVKYDTALEYYANQVPVIPKPEVGDNGKAVVANSNGTYKLQNVKYEPFIVEISDSTGSYTANKTLAEVTEASNSGELIYFKFGPFIALAELAYSGAFRATFVTLGDDGTGTNVMTFLYNAFGIYVDGDGPMASSITATLDPNNLTFVFNSEKHVELVKEGKPFVLSYQSSQSRYLLCQLNSNIGTNTYQATLIDGYVIYAARVVFSGTTATIYNDNGVGVNGVEYLRQISVEPSVSGDGHELDFWGYNYAGVLSFHKVPNFTAFTVNDLSAVSQFDTIVAALKAAAMGASDKKASGYQYVGYLANTLLASTSELLSDYRQQFLLIGKYLLAFDSFVFDSSVENAEAATYRAMDIDSPVTVGTDPVVNYKIRYTVTSDGLAVIEVEANAVPALPIQP